MRQDGKTKKPAQQIQNGKLNLVKAKEICRGRTRSRTVGEGWFCGISETKIIMTPLKPHNPLN
jgi:hypothetical protein